MAGGVTTTVVRGGGVARRIAQHEPWWIRCTLIGVVLVILAALIVVPVANIFAQAFANGWTSYKQAFFAPAPPPLPDHATRHEAMAIRKIAHACESAEHNRAAISTTLFVAALVVPLNTIFGIAAAWLLTKFPIKFRSFFLTLIDLPFSVSPVIAGMIFVLIFGLQGFVHQGLKSADPSIDDHITGVATGKYVTTDWSRVPLRSPGGVTPASDAAALPQRPMTGSETFFGWMGYIDSNIIFHLAGIVLATCFVTFPFVARELIPLMEAQGTEEEQAAVTLGANGWQLFRRVTLVNIKWGLLYGIVLCNARAMGEFGAVNVVSSNVIGTNGTIPIRIQQLFDAEGNIQGAFALATLLAGLALVTLLVKSILEWKTRQSVAKAGEETA